MSSVKSSPSLQGASGLAGALLGPITHTLHEVGGLVLFLKLILKTALTTRGNTPAILEQVLSICSRSLATVVSFITFIGIVVWAYARRNAKDFEEAAQLPFEQD